MSISNIKVLLLNVNRSGWHSGNMIYDMQSISYACDTKIYGPGWEGYDTTDLPKIIEKLYGNDKPDVIYSYFTPNERVGDVYMQHYKIPETLRYFPTNFDKVKNIRKIFALSDFWARKPIQYSNDLNNSGFEYCFCCFAPPYSNGEVFYSFFDENIRKNIKFIGHPRCVDKNCFKDYHMEKKYDIITVGAMWHFYPLRVYMHHVLSSLANNTTSKIKYHNYPHCGSNFSHSNFVREEYAKAINGSKMLASCGGRYHLAMNKIFEAMGCNTLYMGEKPYGESELNLKDDYNYVMVNGNNFVEKVMYYLENPLKMKSITDNANETFLKYHTIEARAEDLVKRLKDL